MKQKFYLLLLVFISCQTAPVPPQVISKKIDPSFVYNVKTKYLYFAPVINLTDSILLDSGKTNRIIYDYLSSNLDYQFSNVYQMKNYTSFFTKYEELAYNYKIKNTIESESIKKLGTTINNNLLIIVIFTSYKTERNIIKDNYIYNTRSELNAFFQIYDTETGRLVLEIEDMSSCTTQKTYDEDPVIEFKENKDEKMLKSLGRSMTEGLVSGLVYAPFREKRMFPEPCVVYDLIDELMYNIIYNIPQK